MLAIKYFERQNRTYSFFKFILVRFVDFIIHTIRSWKLGYEGRGIRQRRCEAARGFCVCAQSISSTKTSQQTSVLCYHQPPIMSRQIVIYNQNMLAKKSLIFLLTLKPSC